MDIILGVFVGFVVLLVLKRFSKGKQVGDIGIVQVGKIEVIESELFVDGIFVSNLVGSDNAIKMLTEEGLAVTILPNKDHFRITLDNFGQRKAILFEATRTLGVKSLHAILKAEKQLL